MTIIYSVTIDELSSPSAELGIESYGAGISIKETGEEAIIRNITLNSSEILSITELLADGCVTPITLSDVIDDLMYRY